MTHCYSYRMKTLCLMMVGPQGLFMRSLITVQYTCLICSVKLVTWNSAVGKKANYSKSRCLIYSELISNGSALKGNCRHSVLWLLVLFSLLAACTRGSHSEKVAIITKLIGNYSDSLARHPCGGIILSLLLDSSEHFVVRCWYRVWELLLCCS